MIPRKIRLGLPTGRRVEVRADLSVRVMLRAGLIEPDDDLVIIDLLDGVLLDDRAQARRLQDALVLHALDTTDPADLHGLADADFSTILDYAARSFTEQPAEDEVEEEDEEVLGVTEPEEPTLEDELERAAAESLPEISVPQSAEVLDKIERERVEAEA